MRASHYVLLPLVLSGCLFVSACAYNVDSLPADRKAEPLLPPGQAAAGLHEPRPETLLQMGTAQSKSLDRSVSVNMHGVPLITMLNTVEPDLNLVPMDGGVDLDKKVSAQVKGGTLGQLLHNLTIDANYAFTVKGNTIEVASSTSKQWNLSAFSSGQVVSGGVGTQTGSQSNGGNGSSAGNGATGGSSTGSVAGGITSSSNSGGTGSGDASNGLESRITQNEDEWDAVVNTARALMGLGQVGGGASSNRSVGNGGSARTGGSAGRSDNPTRSAAAVSKNGKDSVLAIRSLGLIRATGSPRRIARVDRWLSKLMAQSTKQIHLDVKTLEVTLNNNQARGINWEALIGNSVKFGINAPLDLTKFASSAAGFSAQGQNGNDINASIRFLSKYGTVHLLNEPNVTVTNGRTANIVTGNEFSYLASVSQTFIQGGSVSTTPLVQRLHDGVKLAVTPRVLQDGRILVNVVPVITSLQGLDKISYNGSSFSTPNIQLQSLATQVITRPGVPIHIGGLISSTIQDTLNTLPVKQSLLKNPLKWIFTSDQKQMKRQELVVMITPSMIEE
jgi:hypothetical protein